MEIGNHNSNHHQGRRNIDGTITQISNDSITTFGNNSNNNFPTNIDKEMTSSSSSNSNNNNKNFPLSVVLPPSFFIPSAQPVPNTNMTVMTLSSGAESPILNNNPTTIGSSCSFNPTNSFNSNPNSTTITVTASAATTNVNLVGSQKLTGKNNLSGGGGGTISNRNLATSNNPSHNGIDELTLDSQNPVATSNTSFNDDNNSLNSNKNISCVTTTTTMTTTSSNDSSSSPPPVPEKFQQQQQTPSPTVVVVTMDSGNNNSSRVTTVPQHNNNKNNHIMSFVDADSNLKTSVGQLPEVCPPTNCVSDDGVLDEQVRWPAPGIVATNNINIISPSVSFDMTNTTTTTTNGAENLKSPHNQQNILNFNTIQSAAITTAAVTGTVLSSPSLSPSCSTTCSPSQASSQQKQQKNNNIIEPSIDLLNFDSSIVLNNSNNNSPSSSNVGGESITKTTSQHNHLPLTPVNSNNSYCDDLNQLSPGIQNNNKSTSLKLNNEDAFLDFEMSCSSKEIAKVLESFNAILDNEDKNNYHYPDSNDLDLSSSPGRGGGGADFRFTNNLNKDVSVIDSNMINVHLPENRECLRLVDNFSNLLIGDEDDEDLLIIVDSDGEKNTTENGMQHRKNDQSSSCSSSSSPGVIGSGGGSSSHQGHDNSNKEINNYSQNVVEPIKNDKEKVDHHHQVVVDNNDDDDDEDLESEYPDPDTEDVEGYESDGSMRPMVRASMRKLRPVQMLPMPSSANCSAPIQESPFPSPGHGASANDSPIPPPPGQSTVGLATTLNSPVTNHILVTSLINTILSSDSPTTSSVHVNSEVVNNPIYGEISAPLSPPAESPEHTNNNGSSTSPGAATTANAGGSSATTTTATTATTTISGTNIISENNNSSSSTNANNSSSTTENNNATNLTDNNGNSSNNSTSTTTTTGETAGRRNAGGTSPILLGPGIRMPAGRWPHRLSSVLALIGCTLGLNNICRFSLLSVEYGANFILQFLFLSLIFGIPLFTFHMSIGQYLGSGIIDMWRISPVFQGIGIAIVISQAMIGIYTAVGISWIFHYFRDSFITRYDQYRWGKCFREYRGSACDAYLPFSNVTNFTESVADYFHGVVLQRGAPEYPNASSLPSSLKFTVAFNLAVVWMLVFVSLSKGLKSYGKVVHGFVIIPVAALLVLASKMIGLVPADQAGALFGQTAWSNFFFNSQTWVIAAREAFFTWGLLGACVMQVTSHNKFTHSLKSDASIVVLITTFVLLLSAFLGNACYSVLLSHGYSYVPSSFESNKTYTFLVKTSSFQQTPESSLTPSYMNQHISFLMGVRILKPPDSLDGSVPSGYATLRLATELFPATMSILGNTGLSPFWTVLFYFTFILFGIAQQIAIWHCVIRGVIAIKSKILCCWEITITFCVCAIGFVLGLPLCTELGIFITYFLDYAIGSGWWIMAIYLLELVAVFIVRGAPYCGENIVTVLMTGSGKLMVILAPLVSFTWNVILPVAMLVLSIASFKSGNIRELYDWNTESGWPSWTKEIGSFIQLLPILAVPLVAIIKCCLYLTTTGPPDMFERMQQLYRPTSRGLFGRALSAHLNANTPAHEYPPGTNNGTTRNPEDEPPKYTPPPSYSTATGAKIAKFLRNSFRRSMRRLAGGPSTSTADLPPPPNYASVVLEINNSSNNNSNGGNSTATQTHSLVPILLTPSRTMGDGDSSSFVGTENQNQSNSKRYQIPLSQTLGRSLGESKERASLRRIASDITPRDIGRLLRASFRRGSNNNNSNQDNSNNTAFRIESDFTTQQFQNSQAQTQNNLNLSNESLLQQLQYPSSQNNHHNTVSRTVSVSNPSSTLHHHHSNIDSDFLRVPPQQYHYHHQQQQQQHPSNNNTQLLNVSVNVNTNSSAGTNNGNVPHHQVYPSCLSPSSSSSTPSNNNFQNLYSVSGNNTNLMTNFNVNSSHNGTNNNRIPGYTHTRSSSSGSTFMANSRGHSDSQLTLIPSHSSSQNDLSNLDSMTDYRLGGIINPGFQFSQLQLQRHDCTSSLNNNQSEA